MKSRGLFLSALLMGAVMAGCSNDDVMSIENEKSLMKSDNYIAVNIVAPSDFGSRGTEGEFKAGSADENAVKDAWFVFYNATGDYIDAVEGDLEWSEGTGSVEKISTAMIVLSNPQTWPTQVVALLNTGMTKTQLSNLSLKALQDHNDDYSNGFVMSNSVYLNGDNAVTATPLKDSQICSSAEAAKKNPVSIPVERVLAKVVATKSSDFKVVAPEVTPQLDGENANFEIEIKGMALVDTNPKSYLLKNIEGITGWDGWNDQDNWRTYWANSYTPDAYTSDSYDDIVADSAITSYSTYCHENTSGTPTKLLVVAQFKPKGAENFETVIKYNGTYFTVDGLKNYLNDQYFVDIMHGDNNSNNWKDYMSFVSAGTENEWEVALALTNAPTPKDENVDLAAIVKSINNKTMSQWTDGKCYYYVDVEHFGSEGYEVGIVRNHWYDISINSIKGLGTPVFDPTEDIVPGRMEEENYYLAAEVKILKWKMVSQNVDLQ